MRGRSTRCGAGTGRRSRRRAQGGSEAGRLGASGAAGSGASGVGASGASGAGGSGVAGRRRARPSASGYGSGRGVAGDGSGPVHGGFRPCTGPVCFPCRGVLRKGRPRFSGFGDGVRARRFRDRRRGRLRRGHRPRAGVRAVGARFGVRAVRTRSRRHRLGSRGRGAGCRRCRLGSRWRGSRFRGCGLRPRRGARFGGRLRSRGRSRSGWWSRLCGIGERMRHRVLQPVVRRPGLVPRVPGRRTGTHPVAGRAGARPGHRGPPRPAGHSARRRRHRSAV